MPFFDIFASPRWSPLRMRTKVVSFFIFSKSFQTKKKIIKALRPKMTKIASRGGGSCLKSSSPSKVENIDSSYTRTRKRKKKKGQWTIVKDKERNDRPCLIISVFLSLNWIFFCQASPIAAIYCNFSDISQAFTSWSWQQTSFSSGKSLLLSLTVLKCIQSNLLEDGTKSVRCSYLKATSLNKLDCLNYFVLCSLYRRLLLLVKVFSHNVRVVIPTISWDCILKSANKRPSQFGQTALFSALVRVNGNIFSFFFFFFLPSF